jgi:hypothetical protein
MIAPVKKPQHRDLHETDKEFNKRGAISPTGSSARSARAVVEVRRGGGGIPPSALLGGEIFAISDDSYVVLPSAMTRTLFGWRNHSR